MRALLPQGVKVHLALSYIDMRKGIDGLAMLVQGVLRWDPFSGHLFVSGAAPGPTSSRSCSGTAPASACSLATFTSRTILPVSSTLQTLVSLTETSRGCRNEIILRTYIGADHVMHQRNEFQLCGTARRTHRLLTFNLHCDAPL